MNKNTAAPRWTHIAYTVISWLAIALAVPGTLLFPEYRVVFQLALALVLISEIYVLLRQKKLPILNAVILLGIFVWTFFR